MKKRVYTHEIKRGERRTVNKKELIQKLQDIEWEDFEVKEAKAEVPKSSWETVSAFSNTAGYGFDKMFKGWGSHYSKMPVVSTGLDYYRIEFFYDAQSTVKDIRVKTVEKTRVKAVEKTVEKTVEKIIELLLQNPTITQQEIMEKTGLSRRGVEWNLAKLKEAGRIIRIGPDKGGQWKVRKVKER